MLTLLRIAAADLWHDRRLGFCTIFGLASVLAPLLVLAGLRAGVIGGLREVLLQDPNVRQIVSAANREISAASLTDLARRPDVDFLVARTRTLAASLLVSRSLGAGDAAPPEAGLLGGPRVQRRIVKHDKLECVIPADVAVVILREATRNVKYRTGNDKTEIGVGFGRPSPGLCTYIQGAVW